MDAPVAAELPPQMPASTRRALRGQAVELEGVFLNTLMSEMFSSLDTEGVFGGGFAEETWRSMMAEQYANAFAEAGGIGLADAIYADLIATQATSLAVPDPHTVTGAYAR